MTQRFKTVSALILASLAALGGFTAVAWGTGSQTSSDKSQPGTQLVIAQSNQTAERLESNVREARAQLAANSAAPSGLSLEGPFRAVHRAVSPSVVDINVTQNISLTNNRQNDFPISPEEQEELERPFRFFFDRNGAAPSEPRMPRNFRLPEGMEMPEEFLRMGRGSGVIVEVDGTTGYVITNAHVVKDASQIAVTLADGRKITQTELVGSDARSDIAVVKIRAERLIATPFADSDSIQPGDVVLAFGSPFGYVGSMTQGIVSAKDRQIGILGQFGMENFIQVDAAINPGNSGGPLVNVRGEIVGINTAIASSSGSFNGLGFAVPSNQAKMVYEALRKDGKVVRGYLGVGIRDVAEVEADELKVLNYTGDAGVVVGSVGRGTPSQGVIEPGDVITAIAGQNVNNSFQLRSRIAATKPGADVKLSLVRNGVEKEVTVTLAAQPEEQTASRSRSMPPRAEPKVVDPVGLMMDETPPETIKEFNLPDDAKGVVVKRVRPGSLAQRAGLQNGDVIVSIGGTPVTSLDQASELLEKADVKTGVRLSVVSAEGSRMAVIKAE